MTGRNACRKATRDASSLRQLYKLRDKTRPFAKYWSLTRFLFWFFFYFHWRGVHGYHRIFTCHIEQVNKLAIILVRSPWPLLHWCKNIIRNTHVADSGQWTGQNACFTRLVIQNSDKPDSKLRQMYKLTRATSKTNFQCWSLTWIPLQAETCKASMSSKVSLQLICSCFEEIDFRFYSFCQLI